LALGFVLQKCVRAGRGGGRKRKRGTWRGGPFDRLRAGPFDEFRTGPFDALRLLRAGDDGADWALREAGGGDGASGHGESPFFFCRCARRCCRLRGILTCCELICNGKIGGCHRQIVMSGLRQIEMSG
jgi:hypothetical protein